MTVYQRNRDFESIKRLDNGFYEVLGLPQYICVNDVIYVDIQGNNSFEPCKVVEKDGYKVIIDRQYLK